VHPLGDIPDEYVGDRPKWANIPFIAAAQQLIKIIVYEFLKSRLTTAEIPSFV